MTTPQEIVNELVLQTVTGTVTWEISSPFWVSRHDGATFFVNHGDGSLTYVAAPGQSMNRLADAVENWPLYDLLMAVCPPQTMTDDEARKHAMSRLVETATLPAAPNAETVIVEVVDVQASPGMTFES